MKKVHKKSTKKTFSLVLIVLLLVAIVVIVYFSRFYADSTTAATSCAIKDPGLNNKVTADQTSYTKLTQEKTKTSQTQIGSLLQDMKIDSKKQTQIGSLLQDMKKDGSPNQVLISGPLSGIKSDSIPNCSGCKKSLENQAKSILKTSVKNATKEIGNSLNDTEKLALQNITSANGSATVSSKTAAESTTIHAGSDKNITITITTKPVALKTVTSIKGCSKKKTKSISSSGNVSVSVEVTVPNAKKPYKFEFTSSAPIKSTVTIPIN